MKALVRIAGEVNIKSPQVRKKFHSQLVHNLRDCLGQFNGAEVHRGWARFLLELPDSAAVEQAARVFGIGSLSPVLAECPPTMEAMRKTVEMFAPQVQGRTFCVRAKRGGVGGLRSIDIERELGAVLLGLVPATVKLKNPEVEVGVEVRVSGAYFYLDSIAGPGGLPMGSEGRALCMMSGGIDSPVAAWYLMKRGVALDHVFFDLAGKSYRRSVLRVARGLHERWGYGCSSKVFVIPFQAMVQTIQQKSRKGYGQVVLKRAMYRASSALAAAGRYPAIVTGESLGQVSSQTLHNLSAIDGASETVVMRPLLGFDKIEIMAKARQLGTLELSERVQEYCGVVPSRPVTAARKADAAQAEAEVLGDVDWQAMIEQAEVVDLANLTDEHLAEQYLFTDELSEDALVIDTRTPLQFSAWHVPGSRNLPLESLMPVATQENWSKSRPIILLCAIGLESAVGAERLQDAGFVCYSYRGGTHRLRKNSNIENH